jgi:molecular chaperone DnaK
MLEELAVEAETKRVEDTVRREVAELRNRSETLIYTCQRSVEAFGNTLSDIDRQDIESDIGRLQQLLDGDAGPEELREALVALEGSSHQIYEAMLAESSEDDAAEGESEEPAEE